MESRKVTGDGSLSAFCTLLSIFERRLPGLPAKQPYPLSQIPGKVDVYFLKMRCSKYNFIPVENVFVWFLIAGYLVCEFDKFWLEEEPESIMYFNLYREKFHEKIKGLLMDYNAVLTLKT